MSHYFVMFMLEGSTERIDCAGAEHANQVYKAITAERKSMKMQQAGITKTLKEE